jgi:SAM-dependent methyltransferase
VTGVRSLLGRLLRRRSPGTATGAAPVPDPWHEHLPASPWDRTRPEGGAWCPICGWHGSSFDGPAHCEGARCPRCGSIARDRFLLHCFWARTPPTTGLRVLETSPRLDERYRAAMGRWFDYTSSDFDERAHRGAVRIDLQDIDLPDASIDVVLTPHVLEHVPDTDRALSELHRVVTPGGRVFLQIPLLQAATAPPDEPEFHGDDTPVFWRFGWDLTDRLRAAGFDVDPLVTAPLRQAVRDGDRWPGPHSGEFDVDGILGAAPAGELVEVADAELAAQLGFDPAYMFVTWEARRA